jgi:hypothetical protein
MDDFLEIFASILVTVALVFGFIFGMTALFEGFNHDDCHDKGDLVRVQVTYREYDGCYVKDDGLWVPFDIWEYNRDHGYVKQ